MRRGVFLATILLSPSILTTVFSASTEHITVPALTKTDATSPLIATSTGGITATDKSNVSPDSVQSSIDSALLSIGSSAINGSGSIKSPTSAASSYHFKNGKDSSVASPTTSKEVVAPLEPADKTVGEEVEGSASKDTVVASEDISVPKGTVVPGVMTDPIELDEPKTKTATTLAPTTSSVVTSHPPVASPIEAVPVGDQEKDTEKESSSDKNQTTPETNEIVTTRPTISSTTAPVPVVEGTKTDEPTSFATVAPTVSSTEAGLLAETDTSEDSSVAKGTAVPGIMTDPIELEDSKTKTATSLAPTTSPVVIVNGAVPNVAPVIDEDDKETPSSSDKSEIVASQPDIAPTTASVPAPVVEERTDKPTSFATVAPTVSSTEAASPKPSDNVESTEEERPPGVMVDPIELDEPLPPKTKTTTTLAPTISPTVTSQPPMAAPIEAVPVGDQEKKDTEKESSSDIVKTEEPVNTSTTAPEPVVEKTEDPVRSTTIAPTTLATEAVSSKPSTDTAEEGMSKLPVHTPPPGVMVDPIELDEPLPPKKHKPTHSPSVVPTSTAPSAAPVTVSVTTAPSTAPVVEVKEPEKAPSSDKNKVTPENPSVITSQPVSTPTTAPVPVVENKAEDPGRSATIAPTTATKAVDADKAPSEKSEGNTVPPLKEIDAEVDTPSSSYGSPTTIVVIILVIVAFVLYRVIRQKMSGSGTARDIPYTPLAQSDGDIEMNRGGGGGGRGGDTSATQDGDWEEWESEDEGSSSVTAAKSVNNIHSNLNNSLSSSGNTRASPPPYPATVNKLPSVNSSNSFNVKRTSSNEIQSTNSGSAKNSFSSLPTAGSGTQLSSKSVQRQDSVSPDHTTAVYNKSATTKQQIATSLKTASSKRAPPPQDVDLFASIGISAAPKFREPVHSPAKKISQTKYVEEEEMPSKAWDEDKELDDLIDLDD